MSWTKRQFVERAFEELGYASYNFDLDSEQLESALRRLDALMATWNGRGLRLGYPLPTAPESSDLDDKTTVADAANEAVYLNLAIRVAPTIGKAVSAETKASAKAAYNQLLGRVTKPSEQQLPNTMPAGAGNKKFRYDQPFIRPADDNIDAGDDGEIELT